MIMTVTLNASIDKAYHMDRAIENGTVMRVGSIRNTAGGKGLNVARVVRLCGEEVLATGLVGGYNGRYLEALLDADGIRHDFDHIQGETRSCINILDEGFGSTEYLEPGCGVTREEVEEFLRHFTARIKDCSVVTISGSVPKGVPKDIYRLLVSTVKAAGKQVILDTSGELLEMGLKACPTVVKPNQDELELLFDRKIEGLQDVIACGKALLKEQIPYVVISLGGDGALMLCEEGIYQGKPPKVQVANTVGCGDSMVGALAVALHQEKPPREALRYAVAVATANAMSPFTGDFDPAVSRKLLDEVEIVELAV